MDTKVELSGIEMQAIMRALRRFSVTGASMADIAEETCARFEDAGYSDAAPSLTATLIVQEPV